MDRKGEVFQAERLDVKKLTKVRLYVDGTEDLLGGEKKSRVSVEIAPDKENSRSVGMVRKKVEVAGWADKYYWAWKKLKDAGLPTIPTVRRISESEVIMTNMTADGGKFFGKADIIYSFKRFNEEKLTELDELFLNINLDEVNAQAREIANKASLSEVALPYDDPMDLLVHPDGSWEIIILDIDSQMDGNFKKWNKEAIKKFMRSLGYVRRGLSVGGDRPAFVF